jgi:hypothetical protein
MIRMLARQHFADPAGSRLAITVALDAGILPEGVIPKPRIDTQPKDKTLSSR